MTVDVELFGHLAHGGPRRQALAVEESMTVRDLAIRLGLDPESIGLIVIDGVQSEMADSVSPNCRLCFFPPMSGG